MTAVGNRTASACVEQGMDDDIDPENPPALPDWAESYLAEQRQWWQLLRSAGAVSDADALAELQRWTEHH